jgi:hypothetical protein
MVTNKKTMSLISKEDLIKASGLSKIGFLKKPVASAMMNLAKINDVIIFMTN